MKIERIAIADLVEDPSNVRKHADKNLRAIKGSLKRFGQQKPIVVDERNVVIAGNGTLGAAREIGWVEVDVVRTTLKGAEAVAFAIADNRTGELASWDHEGLAKALAALDADGWDLPDMGWDDGDWSKEQDAPPPAAEPSKEWLIVIECDGESQQQDVFEEMRERGLRCKIM